MPPIRRLISPLAGPPSPPMLPRFPRHTGVTAQISGAPTVTPPAPGSVPANDASVSKADFILLAAAAWLKNPLRPLSAQMADDLDRAQRTCEYWLSEKGRDAPAWVIKRAYDRAAPHSARLSDTLTRLGPVVAALPDDRPQD